MSWLRRLDVWLDEKALAFAELQERWTAWTYQKTYAWAIRQSAWVLLLLMFCFSPRRAWRTWRLRK